MKTYLVMGLGATGFSIIDFLLKDQQNKIRVFDTRAEGHFTEIRADLLNKNIDCYFESIDLAVLDDVDELIVSPGVSLELAIIVEAKKRGLMVIGDIELFYRHAQAPIIGITGTNAKSTVTQLVADMLNAAGVRAQIGGNFGVHALKLLDFPVPDYYVLELSSFQLELTETLSCLSASLLNLSPDHLDRHGTMHSYQVAKERIYLNCEHPVYFRGLKYQHAPTKLSYSFDSDVPEGMHDFGVVQHQGDAYLAQGPHLLMKVAELGPGLQGEHNVVNALSALALTAPLHLDLGPQLQVLEAFKGLPYRCVLVRELNDVRWINDSKGTNIGATQAAIKGIAKTMTGRMILILGGMGKDQNFNLLRPYLDQYVAHVIVFGQDKDKIVQALQGLSYELADDLNEVIARAARFAKPHDVVLFSPACASLDMFANYVQRGDMFAEGVCRL